MNLLDSYKIIAYKGSTKSTPETDEEKLNEILNEMDEENKAKLYFMSLLKKGTIDRLPDESAVLGYYTMLSKGDKSVLDRLRDSDKQVYTEEELNESSGPFVSTHPWAYGPDDEWGEFTYSDEMESLAQKVADKMGGEVEGYGIENDGIIVATNGTEYIVDRQGNVTGGERPSFTGLPFTEAKKPPFTEEETPMLRGIEDGKFKPGDSVVFKGGEGETPMKVLRVRRMFGSDLEAVTVVGPLGKTAEYDETQLVKVNESLNENMEQQAKAFFLQLLKKGAIDNLPAEGDLSFLYTQLMMANADGDIEAVEDILYDLRDDKDELFADRDNRNNMDPDEAQLADEDEMFNSYDDDGAPLEETLNEGKMNTKKIEEVGKRASVEAKLAYVNELIEEMTSRLTTLEEDEGMAEMIDKKKLKEMKKDIKLMERMKAKLEKEYAKLEGKGKAKEEAIIDEDAIEENINEERQLTYNDFVSMVRADMNAGAAPDEYVSDKRVGNIAKDYYNRYLQGEKVEDMFESIDEEINLEELANSVNETSYKVGDQDVTLNKGKDPSGVDWTVTFPNGDTIPLNDVLALIKPFPDGLTAGSVGLFENTTLYKTMQRRAGIIKN
jgi:hypothetical protein